MWRDAPGPAFERGDREQSEHSFRDVVEVEVAVLPLSRHYSRIVDVAALIHHVLAAVQIHSGKTSNQHCNPHYS